MNQEVYDLTIIGAGTAGLFAANYAGMRGMKTKIIDYLPKMGGTVSVFYPEKNIYDIGGIPKITGYDFVEQLKEQALMHDPTIMLGEAVEGLEKREDGSYVLTTNKGHAHYTKTVIIAAGAGAFKVRHLKLDNERLLKEEYVHYEPENLTGFEGKRVMVYGGLSAAVNRAIKLSSIAKQVYLVHKGEKFNALDDEMEELRNTSVEVKSACKIMDCRERATECREVVLKQTRDGNEEVLDIDELVISHGYNFDIDPVKSWGFTLENRRIPVDENMETHFEGVFAAGDIAGYPKKWRLISSAFTEAITAVNSAKKCVDPSAPAQVYSSILMD